MPDENNEKMISEELELLTLQQVAEILQLHISTVRRYMHRGDNPLPVIYISPQEIRVKKADLINWSHNLPDLRKAANV